MREEKSSSRSAPTAREREVEQNPKSIRVSWYSLVRLVLVGVTAQTPSFTGTLRRTVLLRDVEPLHRPGDKDEESRIRHAITTNQIIQAALSPSASTIAMECLLEKPSEPPSQRCTQYARPDSPIR